MVASTTRPKGRKLVSATTVEPEVVITEDGRKVRTWELPDGSVVELSLEEIPLAARTTYWNPIFPGQEMWWRSQEQNQWGIQPVMQKEKWIDGKYLPRNEWEEHMT